MLISAGNCARLGPDDVTVPRRHRCGRVEALLQNGGVRRDGPFPLQVHATRRISAVPRALKRFMRVMRMWISAVWRLASLAAMRSPKDSMERRLSGHVIGDAIFAVLCGCGHNIRKILAHLRALLVLVMAALVTALRPQKQGCNQLAAA